MDTTTPLYARGPYRVLAAAALDPAGDDVPARAYVVTDTAGARLREEPSFDAARAWVDGRLEPAFVSTAPRARRR
ncbi:hypothetical protein [Lysobacter humi (ex Lee et al. 2017)]